MIVKAVEEVVALIEISLKKPIESFIHLETKEDKTTLVAKDCSLVSVIRLDGTREIAGEKEFAQMVDMGSRNLRPLMERPGVHAQFWFGRDRERGIQLIPEMLKGVRGAAAAKGMEFTDVFDENERHLANYLTWEGNFIVVWTSPAALPKGEWSRAMKKADTREWVKAADAQYPFKAVHELVSKHEGVVAAFMSSLEDIGLQAELLDVHTALAEAKRELDPDMGNSFRACLPGDPTRPREPEEGTDDVSDLLWPSLRRQMVQGISSEEENGQVERINGRLWAPLDMTLAPLEPQSFQTLLNNIPRTVPFRVSFLLDSQGMRGLGIKRMAARLLSFLNGENALIRDSLRALEVQSRQMPSVKFRVSFATWAPVGQLELLERRVAALTQAIERWGSCQCDRGAGDTVEGIMSSALALNRKSTAVTTPLPLDVVVGMLPLQRPSAPFKTGPALFRTPDGRPWPLRVGSSLQTHWFEIWFGLPGSGKDVQVNKVNLAYLLENTEPELPFLDIMDIGFSGKGFVSLLQSALPLERRHEATFHKMRNAVDAAINPFDTALGCRRPLIHERAALRNLLLMLATPLDRDAPHDGMPELVGFVIDEMYRWRSDGEGQGRPTGAEPTLYLPGVEPEVDAALELHGIKLDEDALWWEVVDALFSAGDIHHATTAQRHAVPLLRDAVIAARRPQVADLMRKTTIGNSLETVLDAFERYITAATRTYPVLAGITKFFVGSSRVCVLDLGEVAPKGGPAENRQCGVMYMLARSALVRRWYLAEEVVNDVPALYRAYYEALVPKLKATPKRIGYGEFHRTSAVQQIRDQVVEDGREGRKWNVQVYVSSQLLKDFDDAMVDLATSIFVMSAGGEGEGADQVSAKFQMGATATTILKYYLRGPKSYGAPFLVLLKTNVGRFLQYLISSPGPIELWALSTTAEDVAIREPLYDALGATRARRILATAYPEGRAKPEVERRKALRAEEGKAEDSGGRSVNDEIVGELLEMARPKIEWAAE